MNFIIEWIFMGSVLALIEFFSIFFIRDGESIWLKLLYSALVIVFWPLVVIAIFIPRRWVDSWLRRLEKNG